MEAVEQLRSTSNLFIGNNPEKWRKAVANYKRVQVHGLYRGIDVSWYGTEGRLEYDLIVKPGADPGQIRLHFEGAHPKLDREGNLVAGFIQKRAVAYQLANDGTRFQLKRNTGAIPIQRSQSRLAAMTGDAS